MSNFRQSDPPAHTRETGVIFRPKDAGTEPLDLNSIERLVDIEVAEPESVGRFLRPN